MFDYVTFNVKYYILSQIFCKKWGFYLQLLLVAEDRPVKIVPISNHQGLKVEHAEQKFANVHQTFVRYFT